MGAIIDGLVIAYRTFMKFIRWNLRLATSAVTGLMAAMLILFCGARLGGERDGVIAVLLVLAVPVWLVVSVISYRVLKPKLENRE